MDQKCNRFAAFGPLFKGGHGMMYNYHIDCRVKRDRYGSIFVANIKTDWCRQRTAAQSSYVYCLAVGWSRLRIAKKKVILRSLAGNADPTLD